MLSSQGDSQRYDEFIAALTAKLNEAGVPAMPAWPDAIDWLIEKARANWCGLCGGYGAWNPVTHQAVPCMACGRESEGLVLSAVEIDEGQQLGPTVQRMGLRVIDGGKG